MTPDKDQQNKQAHEDLEEPIQETEEERQFKAEGLAMAEAIVKGLNEAVLKNYPTT